MFDTPRFSSISSFEFSNVISSGFCMSSKQSSNLLFSSVIIKMEFYTSKFIKPIIQDPSIRIGGLIEKLSPDFETSNSSLSSLFL